MKSMKGIRIPLDEMKLHNVLEGKKTTYPSILKLDEGDLKEVKDWKVGEEYEVKLKIKMIKASAKGDLAPPDDSDADKVHAEFEVIKAECEGKEGEEE